MDKKVLMLKGLPASGKSTYAKNLIKNEPNKWKRINRDSIRLMFAEKFNDQNEKFVLQVRDQLVLQALKSGFNVIIDDLNISPKHEARIRSLVGKNVDVEIDDHFLGIPLNELIRRNANREDSVPEKVIRDLYEHHVNSSLTKEEKSKIWHNKNIKTVKRNYVLYNPNLHDCFIFDIDGTLALMNGREPFAWSRVGEDLPNESVVNLFRKLVERQSPEYGNSFYELFIVSGRDGICEEETRKWLSTYEIEYDSLFMRPIGDGRKDSIIKEEIYRNEIEGKYNVLAVFDDRNQTVAKWRELGLLCCQVAPGDF